ncbi:uncharacterized protein LOC130673391 [Microplitis mediator]|uniref:uncharacterized protein LOC130673391 n=1 Tax=Microplitis mediator TaxID=375433 RepID=UPI002556E1BB|nr:uncharacterized protein LOC130673391 [Microplitis mediator]
MESHKKMLFLLFVIIACTCAEEYFKHPVNEKVFYSCLQDSVIVLYETSSRDPYIYYNIYADGFERQYKSECYKTEGNRFELLDFEFEFNKCSHGSREIYVRLNEVIAGLPILHGFNINCTNKMSKTNDTESVTLTSLE